MSFAGIPISVLLFVFVVSVIILNYTISSPSNSQDCEFPSNHPIVFLVFNIIIVAIIVGSSWPSVEEVDKNYNAGDQVPEEDQNDNAQYNSLEICTCSNSEDEDFENNEDYYDSDGYDGDYDDDENVGCMCHDVEYEQDGYLEKRIEEFIDKVNKGWREERLKDKFL